MADFPYSNPEHIITYSDYTRHYAIDAHDMPMPEDMGHFRHSFEKRRFALIAGLLTRKRVMKVADVGCGNGWLTEMLVRRGRSVVGVDLGFDSIDRASARLLRLDIHVPFVLGDVYRLPFTDASVDAAVASEMIEHLDSPENALAEIARIVRPGGLVVISTPYREKIEQTLCIHCNQKTPVNAHLHSFDKQSLTFLTESAGLAVEQIIVFGSKIAERFGFAGLTAPLPYGLWRAADRLACALTGRQSFIAVCAVKSR